LGREEVWWWEVGWEGGCRRCRGVRVGEGQGEEINRVGEEGVESRERGEVDWVVGVDGEGLLGEGA
jgi:hypothetical protein